MFVCVLLLFLLVFLLLFFVAVSPCCEFFLLCFLFPLLGIFRKEIKRGPVVVLYMFVDHCFETSSLGQQCLVLN